MSRLQLRQIPWSSRDLVRRHGRLVGTGGIFLGGAAAGISGQLAVLGGGYVVAAWIVAGILVLEGCVLAFPRPVRPAPAPRPDPVPPAGATR